MIHLLGDKDKVQCLNRSQHLLSESLYPQTRILFRAPRTPWFYLGCGDEILTVFYPSHVHSLATVAMDNGTRIEAGFLFGRCFCCCGSTLRYSPPMFGQRWLWPRGLQSLLLYFSFVTHYSFLKSINSMTTCFSGLPYRALQLKHFCS